MATSRDLTQHQIFTRKRRLAILVAMSITSSTAFAAEQTLTVSASADGDAQESAWGPAPTIAAKHSATATKTDTPIEKTPQSVSVVTRQEMEKRQPQSVKQALDYSVGVASNRGSSNVIDALAIRGFSETNTNQYFNGLKLQADNYSEFAVDPYFLERIELLRGPSSVIYGKSNPGGVVTMVSKRPTKETIREVQFQMGTRNLYSTGFDFGGAVDDDGVYTYRLTGLARSADAQQEMNKEKRYTIAPSFSWQPDENTNFTFLSYFQNEPETGYYGWLPRQGTVVPIIKADGSEYKLPSNFDEGGGNNKISRNTKMVGYSFDHTFNDVWSVHQNLRYSQLRTNYLSIYGDGLDVATNTINRGYAHSQEKMNEFAVDNQVQAKFSTGDLSHDLLMGVDYQRSRNDINAIFGTAASLDPFNPQYGDDQPTSLYSPYLRLNKQEQTGLYAQDQMELDRWVFTLGGRYDYLMMSSQDLYWGGTTKTHDQAFTWRGGVNYLFDNGISPYFSYSESFIPNTGTTLGGDTFAPSRAKQYEAGVKFVPKDRPIVITGAVYQLTKTNNLTGDPTAPLFSVQGGEIRSRGFEFEAKAAVNANIDLTASYAFNDAEYTEDNFLKGKTPVQAPKHMASVWADYTFRETALSGLTIGTGVRYVGESKGLYRHIAANGSNQDQNFDVAAYTVVDMLVKYDLGRFGMPGSSIGVNVNNLLDREYVSGCYREHACYWGAERQITGTATFRF